MGFRGFLLIVVQGYRSPDDRTSVRMANLNGREAVKGVR